MEQREGKLLDRWRSREPGVMEEASGILTENPFDWEAGYVYASASLPAMILENKDLMDDFKQKKYEERMREYREQFEPAFTALNRALAQSPLKKEELLRECAAAFVEAIKEDMGKRGRKAKTDLLKTRITLALYTIPMIRLQELEDREELADAMIEEWTRVYPKEAFIKGSFEEINQSFRKKLCYITTAVCRSLEKPDDCRELTAFRRFRDEYLLEQPGGEEAVSAYYETAPWLVACMNTMPECGGCYRDIWDTWLSGCFAKLEAGDPEGCFKEYRAMVAYLEKRYFPWEGEAAV